MKVLSIALSAVLLAAAGGAAHADNDHRRHDQNRRSYNRDRQDAWRNVAFVQTAGNGGTIELDQRAGRIDDLRLEVNRGAVNLRNVVVVFGDGNRYVAPVNQQLGTGSSHLVRIPGPPRRIDRIELNYSHGRRSFWQRAFVGNRAQISVFAS